MNDKELGKALLALDTTPKVSELDPRSMTRNIVARDRWRIRILAGIATFFRVVTTVGIIYLAAYYVMLIQPRLNAYAIGQAKLESDWRDWALAVNIAGKGVILCIVSLFLAAISTVLLILFSRHATLRQINASLSELAERLNPAKERGSASVP
jgi:hypothetical protein